MPSMTNSGGGAGGTTAMAPKRPNPSGSGLVGALQPGGGQMAPSAVMQQNLQPATVGPTANSGSSTFNAGARPGGVTVGGGPGQSGGFTLPAGGTSTVRPMAGPALGGGGGDIFGGPPLQPGPQPIAPSNPFAPPTMGGGGASTPYVPGPRPPGVETTGGPGPGGFTAPGGDEGSIPLPPNVPPPGTGGEPNGTPSFLDILMQQFGRNNPFGDMPAGPDPIAAARAQADAWVNPRLADLRERFAGTGIASNSGRSGLEQGRLAGAAEAGLGTNLAQLGVAQRGTDLDRLMGGFLDAGRLSLGQQQLPIQALQALMGGGQTLLGLQESERIPPLLQAIMPFLESFAPQRQTGYSTTR